MTNETQLANVTRFPSMEVWQQMVTMSDALVKSQALPNSIKNKEQLAMVLLSGKEAGMGAMESLSAYYIVNGKITIYGQATLSQLKRSGFRVKWGECDTKTATVTIIHPDGNESTETYTMEEAVKTGQTGKDPWVKFPKAMLRWKALAANIRFNCPEVLNGYYLTEDLTTEGLHPEAIDIDTINQPTEAIAEADNE